MCKDQPKEFAEYLRYARSLEFTETPDYKRLIRMFENLMKNRGWYPIDWEFDWIEKLNSYSKKSESKSTTTGTSNVNTTQTGAAGGTSSQNNTTNQNLTSIIHFSTLDVTENFAKQRNLRSSSAIRNVLDIGNMSTSNSVHHLNSTLNSAAATTTPTPIANNGSINGGVNNNTTSSQTGSSTNNLYQYRPFMNGYSNQYKFNRLLLNSNLQKN